MEKLINRLVENSENAHWTRTIGVRMRAHDRNDPRVRVALVIWYPGGGGPGPIGEECNRWFIDEAWVSECRLLGPRECRCFISTQGGGGKGRRSERITPNKLLSETRFNRI